MKKLAMLILSGALMLSLFALPGAAAGKISGAKDAPSAAAQAQPEPARTGAVAAAQPPRNRVLETSQTAPSAAATDVETATITVRGKKAELVYSLDYPQRMYHVVRDYDASRELETLWSSLSLTARKANLKTAPKAGFFAHLTNGEKTVLYVDDKQAYDPDTGKLYKSSAVERGKLIALGKRCNGISTGTPMWIAYMSDDNITGITYSGTDYYLTPSWSGMSLNLTATDNPEAVKEVAQFLKRGGLTIVSGKSYSGSGMNPTSTPDVATMNIKFKSGASYYILLDEYGLFIDVHGYGMASYQMDDLSRTTFYSGMRDFCKRYRSITPVG